MGTDLFKLTNKTALVVGASSGIGEQFAKCLSNAGATVLLAARRIDRLEALQQALKQQGGQAHCYKVDVTDDHSVQALFRQIEQDGLSVDVVLNAAGINIRKPLLEYSLDDWQAVMKVNLDGAWLVSQETARHMIKHKVAGSIIHISSTLDDRTLITSTHAYHASKAGVRQMVKSLAIVLVEHGIRINCIAPGWFETDINRDLLRSEKGKPIRDSIPMKRTGKLSELEGVLLLLASDASSYMTGSVVRVDGGYASNHIAV